MIKERLSNEKGFTLVEVLLAAIILVIVLGIAFNFLKAGFDLNRNITEHTDLHHNIRFAMDSIARDLKNATDVTLINSSRIRFTDGQNNQQVEYRLSGNQLIRDENNSNSPVAENIISLTFTKQDNLVGITMIANQNNKQITLRSNVFLKRDLIE